MHRASAWPELVAFSRRSRGGFEPDDMVGGSKKSLAFRRVHVGTKIRRRLDRDGHGTPELELISHSLSNDRESGSMNESTLATSSLKLKVEVQRRRGSEPDVKVVDRTMWREPDNVAKYTYARKTTLHSSKQHASQSHLNLERWSLL